MRRKIKEEDGSWIWFDSEEEYTEYMRKKEQEKRRKQEAERRRQEAERRKEERELERLMAEMEREEEKERAKKTLKRRIFYSFLGILFFFFLVGYCSRKDDNNTNPNIEIIDTVKSNKVEKKSKPNKNIKSKKKKKQQTQYSRNKTEEVKDNPNIKVIEENPVIEEQSEGENVTESPTVAPITDIEE